MSYQQDEATNKALTSWLEESTNKDKLRELLVATNKLQSDEDTPQKLTIARHVLSHIAKHCALDASKTVANLVLQLTGQDQEQDATNTHHIFSFTQFLALKTIIYYNAQSSELADDILDYAPKLGEFHQYNPVFWSAVVKKAPLFFDKKDQKKDFIDEFGVGDISLTTDEEQDPPFLPEESEHTALLPEPQADLIDADTTYQILIERDFSDNNSIFRQTLDAMMQAYNRTNRSEVEFVGEMNTLANAKKALQGDASIDVNQALTDLASLSIHYNKNKSKVWKNAGLLLGFIGILTILVGLSFIILPVGALAATAALQTILSLTVGGAALTGVGGFLFFKNKPTKAGHILDKLHTQNMPAAVT